MPKTKKLRLQIKQIFLRKTCLLSCPRATPRRPRCTDQSIRDSKKRRGAIFRVLLVRRVGARQPRNPVGTKLNQARNQAVCYPKLIRKGCQPDSYYNTIIKVREHGTKLRTTPQPLSPPVHARMADGLPDGSQFRHPGSHRQARRPGVRKHPGWHSQPLLG